MPVDNLPAFNDVVAIEAFSGFAFYLHPDGRKDLRCSFINNVANNISFQSHHMPAPKYSRAQMLNFIRQLYNIPYKQLHTGPPPYWGFSAAAMAFIEQARHQSLQNGDN